MTGLLLEPGYAFRSGRIVTERIAAHLAPFELDGRRKEAFSIGSSEHFALPRLPPTSTGADGGPAQAPLTDARVYLGWLGIKVDANGSMRRRPLPPTLPRTGGAPGSPGR